MESPPGSTLTKTNIPSVNDKFKSLATSPWYAKIPKQNFASETLDTKLPSERKLKKREAKKLLKRIKAELDLLNDN